MREMLEDSVCLFAHHAIYRDNERGKGAPLFQAFLGIFVLFLFLVEFQHLGRRFGEVSWLVCIGKSDIDDAVSTLVPKTTYK